MATPFVISKGDLGLSLTNPGKAAALAAMVRGKGGDEGAVNTAQASFEASERVRGTPG